MLQNEFGKIWDILIGRSMSVYVYIRVRGVFLTSETSSYRLVERVDESVDHGCMLGAGVKFCAPPPTNEYFRHPFE